MQIAVASGKGGTGKTLIATTLVKVLNNQEVILVDADVEEPNDGLILGQTPHATEEVHRLVPYIDPEHCTLCGDCAKICNFNALVVIPNQVLVFNELCHSCGACVALCPHSAIGETQHPLGLIEETLLPGCGTLYTGRLNVGEALSPPLIKACKQRAPAAPTKIIDCPPGTTCAMIESIRDSDYCLLVTEPTPLGRHDLELSLEALQLLNIPGGLIINRWQGDDHYLSDLSSSSGFPILARIPFSTELARSYMQGADTLEAMPELHGIMTDIIRQIKEAV